MINNNPFILMYNLKSASITKKLIFHVKQFNDKQCTTWFMYLERLTTPIADGFLSAKAIRFALFVMKYKFDKNLPSDALSIEFRGCVQNATVYLSGNTTHNEKLLCITHKTALCIISSNVLVSKNKRVSMKLISARIHAIFKFSFVEGRSDGASFLKNNYL